MASSLVIRVELTIAANHKLVLLELHLHLYLPELNIKGEHVSTTSFF